MLIERKTTADGAIIGIWHIVETENQLLSLFKQPDKLQHQMAAISNTEKRCEKLAVRALLHDLTGEEKLIGYLSDGKPYLSDGSFYISISHTKHYACIILHSIQIVGIDIEAKTSRAARIQQRFLSPAEYTISNQTSGFVVPLLFWTAKEALFKLVSNPALDFINHIQVTDINWNEQIITASIASIDHPFKLFFTIEPDYVLSHVCASTEATEIHNLV